MLVLRGAIRASVVPVQDAREGKCGERLVKFTQQVHSGLVGNRLPVWPSAHVTRGDAAFADQDWFAEAAGLAGEVGYFDGVEVALEMLRNRFGFRLARVDVDIHKIELALQQCEGSRGDTRVFCLILGPSAGSLPADGVERENARTHQGLRIDGVDGIGAGIRPGNAGGVHERLSSAVRAEVKCAASKCKAG